MKTWRRCCLTAIFCLATIGVSCAAQWKPDRALEIIVGVAPGGALDITARDMMRILQNERLVSVPVSVVNRPGAGSAIAWTYLNQHPRDGHYVSISAPNLVTNALVGGNPLKAADVTPLANLFSEYIACSVRPDSNIRSGRDLVNALRENPERYSIGIASARGATNHIAAGAVFNTGGVDLRRLKFVVFKSSQESLTALLGGHIDVDFSTVSNVLGHLQAQRIRVLGVTAPKRLTGAASSVPTWSEQALPVDFSGWRGVIAPNGLSTDQITYWDATLEKLAQSPEWLETLTKHFWVSTYMNSARTRVFLDEQQQELAAVLGGLGLLK